MNPGRTGSRSGGQWGADSLCEQALLRAGRAGDGLGPCTVEKVSILYGVTFGASRALLILILPVLGVGVVHREVRKPQLLQVMQLV